MSSFFSLKNTKWPASDVWTTSDVLDVGLSAPASRAAMIRCDPVRCTSTLIPGYAGLEELGDLLRAGQRQRRVPDDLAFLLRRLEPRVLRAGGVASARGRRPRGRDGAWFEQSRVMNRPLVAMAGSARSPTAAGQLVRRHGSSGTPLGGRPRGRVATELRLELLARHRESGPPRGWSCRSSITRPSRHGWRRRRRTGGDSRCGVELVARPAGHLQDDRVIADGVVGEVRQPRTSLTRIEARRYGRLNLLA